MTKSSPMFSPCECDLAESGGRTRGAVERRGKAPPEQALHGEHGSLPALPHGTVSLEPALARRADKKRRIFQAGDCARSELRARLLRIGRCLSGSFHQWRHSAILPQAKAAAAKAIEIDDSLAEPHVTMAFIHLWFVWDWAGAEREAKRAIELNPNLAFAHMAQAQFLTTQERHAEALAEAAHAR